jgi:tetratricopeptide (TPR) repeat protein
MIARNEGATLGRCLASAAGVADEVIVVDTGSGDDTVAVASGHGATVVHRRWTDDFAAARNVALERAQGRWILVLDADEELPPDTRARLRDVVEATDADGLEVPIQNLRGGEVASVHVALRLFRNVPALRYVGRVHERVRVARCAAAWLPILHHGYADPATLAAKLARNRALLERAVAEEPDEPLLRYYLAATCLLSGEPDETIRFAEDGLGLASASRVDARMLCLYALGLARLARGDAAAAEAAWTEALALRPDWIDARLQLGLLCHGAGRAREAIAHLGRFLVDRQALAADRTWPLRFPVLTTLLEEPTARARLAATYASLGMFDAAQREAARALNLSPDRTDFAHLLARIRAERARPWRSRHDAQC